MFGKIAFWRGKTQTKQATQSIEGGNSSELNPEGNQGVKQEVSLPLESVEPVKKPQSFQIQAVVKSVFSGLMSKNSAITIRSNKEQEKSVLLIDDHVKNALVTLLMLNTNKDPRYAEETRKTIEFQIESILTKMSIVADTSAELETFITSAVENQLFVVMRILLQSGITSEYESRATQQMLSIRLRNIASYDEITSQDSGDDGFSTTRNLNKSEKLDEFNYIKRWYIFALKKYFNSLKEDEKIHQCNFYFTKQILHV